MMFPEGSGPPGGAPAAGDAQALLDALPVAVASVDAEGRLRFLNRAAVGLLQPGPSARFLWELFPEQPPSMLRDALAGTPAEGERRVELHDPVRGRWLAVELAPAGAAGWTATVADVTPRRRLEAELAACRAAEAAGANRLKEAFLRAAPHEIRTPLAIITGSAELLREIVAERLEHDLPPEVEDCLEAIETNGRRLNRTLALILHTARLLSEAPDRPLRPVSLGSLLEQVVGRHRPSAEQKQLELTCVRETADDGALVDEFTVTQLFEHLIENAIKFTPSGKVEVRLLRGEDGALQVSIRDTGIGMSDAYLGELFGLFSQEDDAPTRRYEGLGLGLALARRCADLNRAEIAVESEKGRGTRIVVAFRPPSAPPRPR